MAECATVSRDPAHGKRRFRGIGHGRKTRRVLDRGGTGSARALNAALGTWDGVRITPMFGRWGYFVGARLFACFPLRDKDHDLWIREPGGRPPRGLAQRGWIEVLIESETDVARALRWLRRAWSAASQATGPDDEPAP